MTLKLEEDGSVLLVTGAVEIGTGAVALQRRCSSQRRSASARPTCASPPRTPTRSPTTAARQGSRTTVALANAIDAAAASLREQIRAVGAELLEADPETLHIADGTVVDARGASVPLAAVAEAALWTRGPIVATGTTR